MNQKQFDKAVKLKEHNSELLLKILNNACIQDKTNNEKEFYVDQNWKINSKDLTNNISKKNQNLEKILSDSFPKNKVKVTTNRDGSQTIQII